MNRRNFLELTATTGLTAIAPRLTHADTPIAPRYRVSVCDWMMLKRQKLGAIALAAEIGADGVEVDMGSLGQRETSITPSPTP